MTRKLATITTIASISPIPGADRIVAVTMTTNNWTCVAGRDEFKVGDKAVYFEIDSFLPKEERYKFLEGRANKTMNGIDGYRLKTMRLKGQLSQGLVMPIDKFGYTPTTNAQFDNSIADGTDVTELLGIQVYEPPKDYSQGEAKGPFPYFISKTDQERIQNIRGFDMFKLFDHTFEVTEKLDGSSITMYYNRIDVSVKSGDYSENSFGVCSRNEELKRPEEGKVSTPWRMADKYHIEYRLTRYCKENNRLLALQGEMCGPKVQGNPLGLRDVEFFVFDIYDIAKGRYVQAQERYEILEKLNSIIPDPNTYPFPSFNLIQHVPIIWKEEKIYPDLLTLERALQSVQELAIEKSKEPEYQGVLMDDTIWPAFLDNIVRQIARDLLFTAEGKTYTNSRDREGLVYKSTLDSMISFKVINDVHLLKED